ncbi:tRNA-dihydrouridine synthase [Haloarcula onubensis]|uniref:tRNA-dihydrouridine synthase n=1 Tax=Haloarcula onubensis TaxID=2950539 RepID=A0ABU2FQR9_9EURY|nr:tRNA-dihydrouridine synthase [Halomicroarcula sp. S3CR25-11]MDS0283110.1 tRNA-dihydrouridine synthase [Halomicroarcula sp. S3CR25-11]
MFGPRVALASLSGEADADWARAVADHVGCAFLGAVALDAPTRAAARAMTDRERSEFLPADPVAFVDAQLTDLADAPLRGAFNVRSTTLGPIEDAAAVCRDHDAVLELNAHCRQDEMCAAGAGETLLWNPERLAAQVRTAADVGADVSVKVRAEVPGVDLPALARRIEVAGADAVHVDAMDSESVVADVADATDLFVVANNGVRGRETAREYFAYGADAVSVGRPSDDPDVLAAVRGAAEAWFRREVTG